MPNPTTGSITQLTTEAGGPLPRYTPVLVADPTPPLPHAAADTAAAEAVTGGWTREAPTEPYGEYWIKMRGEDEPTICDVRPDPLRVFGYCVDDVELWGPALAPPPGWREALAALDQES